ncbi:TfuA-like protein [Sorangium sp. So ce124]|uniref:TfuA-like protein n=1 Tax=Sorangium sp. So ce124 TaxID=3133280 RepID=UPI003F625DB9
MSIIVFIGPTLSLEAARAELDAIYLPPVSQGDVYRACAKRPSAIAIIDGYFERVPAVWHKEILFAMAQGIHVFGSSSMGALRAAELSAFGMEGVGAIFEGYRDGLIEDDDEVAVVHGPADSGFRAGSEAMVNLRRTFDAAAAAGVITAATRDALTAIAKSLYYPDRAYPVILDAASRHGVPQGELASLRDFLPKGRVNQKRDDAIALLRHLRARAEAGFSLKTVTYRFEVTEFWCRAEQAAGEMVVAERPSAGDPSPYETVALDGILDELRLDAAAYGRAKRGAMLRYLALQEAERRGLTVDNAALERTSDAFRRERRLYEPDDVKAWMRRFSVGWGELTRLLRDEALIGWVEKATDEVAQGHVRDHLSVSGEYAELLSRARDKQQRLAELGLSNPAFSDAGMAEGDLIRWYFERCLGAPVPPDPAGALRSAGFADADEFKRVALREVCYRRAAPGDRAASASAPERR